MGEYTENKQVTVQQRVFYVLKRTRLSRRRMIWLLPLHLLFSPPVCKLSLSACPPVCRQSSLLTRKGGKGRETNHTTARKPGLLSYIKYSLL
jgi:hypothetical protein